jgi:hypothetical protein
MERMRYKRDWEERLAKQAAHEVHLPLEILWDQPWDEKGCTLRKRMRLAVDESYLDELRYHEDVQDMRVSWTQVVQWEGVRKEWIKKMRKDPLMAGWISEYFRPILIELCRKRLANPGKVLEFLLTGGNRPGKTNTCIHLLMCNFIYSIKPLGYEMDEDDPGNDPWKGQVMILHESEGMSRKWHHPVVFHYLPKDLKLQARKKANEETAFNYNAKGFTNDWFQVFAKVEDETGREYLGGGRWELRNYGQAEDTFQGGEYNSILSDELLPPPLMKTLNARLASRAELTRETWFLDRIRELLRQLEAGVPFNLIHRALLGAVVQCVHMISFTPIKFYTATVKIFLAGARKYRWVEAPVLKTLAGVTETRVPRFAQPTDPQQLVAYLPTSANIFKPAYHAVMSGAMSGGVKQLKMKLYGDVDKEQHGEFDACYDPLIHLCDWKDMPRNGTIYEVFDPAGAKPWAMGWYLVDELQRIWMLQEWPCESIKINGGLPGPWAIVSAGDRMNGDEGTAYELRLGWSIARWVLQIWEGRARILEMMEKTGEPWQGSIEEVELVRSQKGGKPQKMKRRELLMDEDDREEKGGKLEAFVKVAVSIIDSRFAGTKMDNPKGGEQITVLERLFDDPNSILCEPAEGVALDEGNLLIASKLAERVLDGAALKINRECTNTQFMLANYTLPEFRETTAKKDEVCKEWRDLLAYLLLSGPRHIDAKLFERNAEEEFGYG